MPKLSSYSNQSIDLKANQLTGFYITAALAFNELSLSYAPTTMLSLNKRWHDILCIVGKNTELKNWKIR